MKATPQQRELRRLCTALSKTIGAGHKPDAAEMQRRFDGWKKGHYDPTTGVWS